MNNLEDLAKQFADDGVVLIRQLFSSETLKLLSDAVEYSIKHPTAMFSDFSKDDSGEFLVDFLNFRRNPYLQQIINNRYINLTLSAVVGTSTIRFFHDSLFVKRGLAPMTPWHHDRPYYVVGGSKNFSMWTSIDDVSEDNSLAFIRGSHKFGRMFVPTSFKDGETLGIETEEFEYLTTNRLDELARDGILIYRYSPGDAIVFDNRTLHRGLRGIAEVTRRAMSFRYIGDGAYLTRRCIDPTPPMEKLGLKFEEGDAPLDPWFPLLFSRNT